MTTIAARPERARAVRAFGVAAGIALAYLFATAAWSPFDEWWIVDDSHVYLDAAASIDAGYYEVVPGDSRRRFARPPLYPATLWVLGAATNDGTPWLALLWNVVCVGFVGWALSGCTWLRHGTLAVVIAAVICLPHVPMIHSDMTGVGLASASIGLLLRWPGLRNYGWAGIVLGLAILSRQSAGGTLLTVFAFCIMYIIAGQKSRKWTKIACLALLPLVAPVLWLGYVYSEAGMLALGSHNMGNNLLLRTVPGIRAEGDPRLGARYAKAMHDWYWPHLPDTLTEAQRVEHDWDQFFNSMEGQWGRVPKYVSVTLLYALFSSPGDWQVQFGPLVPRWFTRGLYALLGLLVIIGMAAYIAETWNGLWPKTTSQALSLSFIAMFILYLGMVIIAGASISQRHLLPAVLARSVFYAYGIGWTVERAKDWRLPRCSRT